MSRKAIGLVLLLIISAVGVAVPIVSANDSGPTPIDGADNRENAIVLQKGVEYDFSAGWYKVYIEDKGSKINMDMSDASSEYFLPDYFIDKKGTTLRYEVENDTLNEKGGISRRHEEDMETVTHDFNWIVQEEGFVYIYIDGGLNLGPEPKLEVTTKPPNSEIYSIQSVDIVPSNIEPGERVTIQTRIRYDRDNLNNFEFGNVHISVNDTLIHNESISPNQGDIVTINADYTAPINTVAENPTVAIRTAPTWTNIENGIETQATISVDAEDTDNDGLYDSREEELGTDPRDADTDDDGLDDGREIELGTDPLEADTDGDGLTDSEEVNGDTDPLESDTDGDGLPDGKEVSIGSDPTLVDTDDDGVDDPKEVELGTDPASADTDNDGLSDQRELEEGTDPTKVDTDGDGLPDAKEIELGTDPESVDTDGDGISDYDEYQQGTDPLNETESSGETGTNESEVVADRSLVVKSNSVNLQLRSQKTIVNQDEPAVLTFSSTALISADDTVNVQLVLEAPSGVSVGGTDFVESGMGQYTTTYELEPGNSRGHPF